MIAQALQAVEPSLHFEGFGDRRLEQAGVALWARTTRWASLGPLAAIPRIPRLLAVGLPAVARLLRQPPDLIVLVDYGAFHLRLARFLRFLGYRKPIVYFFPPSAWSARAAVAQRVAAATIPVTPFAKQSALYRDLQLRVDTIVHPLTGILAARPPRPKAPSDGGRLLLLPGSREQELHNHVPVMLDAVDLLRKQRPQLSVEIVAAEPRFRARLEAAIGERRNIGIVEGAHDRYATADVVLSKSGTAVLEAALCGAPTVAMYILSPQLAWIVKHIFRFRGQFVTLPNLILGRMSVSERLQTNAQATLLAADLEALLIAPDSQLADFAELRQVLMSGESLTAWATRTLATLTP